MGGGKVLYTRAPQQKASGEDDDEDLEMRSGVEDGGAAYGLFKFDIGPALFETALLPTGVCRLELTPDLEHMLLAMREPDEDEEGGSGAAAAGGGGGGGGGAPVTFRVL